MGLGHVFLVPPVATPGCSRKKSPDGKTFYIVFWRQTELSINNCLNFTKVWQIHVIDFISVRILR